MTAKIDDRFINPARMREIKLEVRWMVEGPTKRLFDELLGHLEEVSCRHRRTKQQLEQLNHAHKQTTEHY